MKVLVTGASGFIGSGLVNTLTILGHEVCALMRPSASTEYLKDVQFTRISGDLRDMDSLKRACDGVDAVIHLAGLTAAKNREEFFKYNAQGTKNLADAAAASPTVKRFVYVSSLAAAGPSVGLAPKTENDPDSPVSFYGESKLRGELYLEELKGKLPYVVIRPPIVYGPRDKNLHLLFKLIQKNWMPILPSKSTTGHKYYSAIHVEDLIQVLALTLSAPESLFKAGEKFFATDGNIYTNERIVGIIAQDLNVKPFKLKIPASVIGTISKAATVFGNLMNQNLVINEDKLHELLPDYWICSGQKAFDQLGFKPKYTMDTGIPQTIAWYKVHGWL